MEKVVLRSGLNQMLLIYSVIVAVCSLIIQEWINLKPLPIYVSISWAIFLAITSVWLSCYLLRLTLKANSPLNLEFMNKWIYKKLGSHLRLHFLIEKDESVDIIGDKNETQKSSSFAQESRVKYNNNTSSQHFCKTSSMTKKKLDIENMTHQLNEKCIEIWYKNISSDRSFADKTQNLLSKLLKKLVWKAGLIDKITLTNKLANIMLLHLKEYRRYECRNYFYINYFADKKFRIIYNMCISQGIASN